MVQLTTEQRTSVIKTFCETKSLQQARVAFNSQRWKNVISTGNFYLTICGHFLSWRFEKGIIEKLNNRFFVLYKIELFS